ncbi:hypothetical protein [Persicobacter diffluens]|uniref:Uncharacterized protein n=1 Tax=Persicobacter diffluens TaxID=981 RepID=A0AAN5AJ35_9BACT|nr:hypothetical protein PEDI_17320 [Persicobacter diffluens]
MPERKLILPERRLTNVFQLDIKELIAKFFESDFEVHSYSVKSFRNKGRDAYAELYREFKQQVDHAFYFWSHAQPDASIFTLSRGNEQLPVINLFDQEVRPVFREDLPEHVVIKLLMMSYEYVKGGEERRYYSHRPIIRTGGSDRWLECMNLEPSLVEGKPELVLRASVGLYARVNSKSKPGDRFERCLREENGEIVEGLVLAPKEKWDELKSAGNLYERRVIQGKKPNSNWYTLDYDKKHLSRGWALYHFMHGFVEYISNTFGQNLIWIKEDLENWEFLQGSLESRVNKAKTELLPIECLGELPVYLNLNRQYGQFIHQGDVKAAFTSVMKKFNEKQERNIQFRFIDNLEGNDFALCLQDANLSDFDEENKEQNLRAFGLEDPKKLLYTSNKAIALQSMVINPNSGEKWDSLEDFHDYDLTNTKFERNLIQAKIPVSLNELFKKTILMKNWPVDTLPEYNNNAQVFENYAYYYDYGLLYFERNSEGRPVAVYKKCKDEAVSNVREYLLPLLEKLNIPQERFFEVLGSNKRRRGDAETNQARRYLVLSQGGLTEIKPTAIRPLPDYELAISKWEETPAKYKDRLDEETGELIERVQVKPKLSKSKTIIGHNMGIWLNRKDRKYTIGLSQSPEKALDKAAVEYEVIDYLETKCDIQPLINSMLNRHVKYKSFSTLPTPFDILRMFQTDLKDRLPKDEAVGSGRNKNYSLPF